MDDAIHKLNHALRTPLAAVPAALDMLAETIGSGKPICDSDRELIDIVRKCVRRHVVVLEATLESIQTVNPSGLNHIANDAYAALCN